MSKLDEIKDTISDITGKVADKSTEIYEKGKLKKEIHDKTNELGEMFQSLGKKVYKQSFLEEVDNKYLEYQAQIETLVIEISKMRRKIEELKEKDNPNYFSDSSNNDI